MIGDGARRRRLAPIALMATVVLVVSALPVMAELASLSKLPLGRGTATITWTGQKDERPSALIVRGTAGGHTVSGTADVPERSANQT
jgi:hypothetical protein